MLVILSSSSVAIALELLRIQVSSNLGSATWLQTLVPQQCSLRSASHSYQSPTLLKNPWPTVVTPFPQVVQTVAASAMQLADRRSNAPPRRIFVFLLVMISITRQPGLKETRSSDLASRLHYKGRKKYLEHHYTKVQTFSRGGAHAGYAKGLGYSC